MPTSANVPQFSENLVRLGIEGGKQAATALRNTVLDNCNELTDQIEIMAKVCANITGLSKAMRRDGSLENPEDLKEFTLGFTQGKASFDFIDVGHGKERADSKIRENLRWHLRNYNCKQVLLGISHDAGYAPFLDEVVSLDDRSKITIMEGPPTVRELKNTGIQVINFNNIFRSEKLIDRVGNNEAAASTWAGVSSSRPPDHRQRHGPRKSEAPHQHKQAMQQPLPPRPMLQRRRLQLRAQEPVCTAFGCRFSKEDHPPNTIIKHPRKEKYERESYF
ncbi:hypothetical protein BUE80_DR013899 [Diplocarpon rosae]|nr:hypothetical protein BUE80_DR013899 [Diplocarpon rosae]